MTAGMQKSTLRNTTARVLVLGDQQVGKSAAIVRYTTGRFIQHYCGATNDWLYRHPIGYDSARNQFKLVELLEQRDIQFSNFSDESPTSDSHDSPTCNHDEGAQQRRRRRKTNSSLSSRVALDRQIDEEFFERQQLLNKLHWANAYVIMYALNSSQSFNKAIKYLNLVANEVNNQQVGAHARRRPTLLLANKSDLEREARQVSHSDGRLLAMRHQCLFAELSVGRAAPPIEQALANLLDSIQPAELHTARVGGPGGEQILTQTQLTHWLPGSPTDLADSNSGAPTSDHHLNHHHHHNQQQQQQQQQHKQQQQQQHQPQPVWSSLVRSRPPLVSFSSSQAVVQSSCLAVRARRLNESDFRLLTPVGMSLSSGSSSSSSSACSGGSLATASSSLVMAQPQVARPLVALLATKGQAGGAGEPVVAARLVAMRPSVSSISSASSSAGNSGAGQSAPAANPTARHGRYQSLKSSFRKASLTIVGSRSFAARVAGSKKRTTSGQLSAVGGHSLPPSINELRISEEVQQASDSDGIGTAGGQQPAAVAPDEAKRPGQRVSWIRSKINSLGKDTSSNSDTSSLGQAAEAPVTRALPRRPLFKYKSRRKTVAFEPAFKGDMSLGHSAHLPATDNQSLCQAPLAQATGGRSLAASQAELMPQSKPACNPQSAKCQNLSYNVLYDAQCPIPMVSAGNETMSSLFIVDGESLESAPDSSLRASTCRPAGTRRDSHSTLSRASTSGGSCDEDSELEIENRPELKAATLPPCESMRPMKSNHQHHQLVRSVQNTWSAVGTPPGQAVKRSLCNALFNSSGAARGTLVKSATISPGASQFAKVERLQTIPLMGFCK